MKSASSGTKCFNCEGSGTCVMYPRVESLIATDASWSWILSDALEWVERPCPYCTDPDPFPFPFLEF